MRKLLIIGLLFFCSVSWGQNLFLKDSQGRVVYFENQLVKYEDFEIVPQKFIINPETTLLDFEDTSPWISLGTMSLNSQEKIEGNYSIKISSSVSTAGIMERNVDLNLGSDTASTFRLRVYPNSSPDSTFTSIFLFAGNEVAMTNRFKATINAPTIFENEWNILWGLNWTIDAGTPSWDSIKYFRIRVNTASGQISECSFDFASTNEEARPAVVLSFDDGSSTVFTNAYPALKARNMPATAYVIGSFIGLPGRLSAANLQELDSEGWSLSNHLWDNTDLTTISKDSIITELQLTLDTLIASGVGSDGYHVAYPQGRYNDTVFAAMIEWGGQTGRVSNNRIPTNWDIDWPYKLSMISPSNTTPVSDVKDWMDRLIEVNSVGFLNFHNIKDSDATGEIDYLTADFIEILEYIRSSGIRVITIDDYYRSYSNEIKLSPKIQ